MIQKILHSLMLLTSLAWGQSVPPQDYLTPRLEKLEVEMQSFQHGRSTNTSFNYYAGSIAFTTNGAGIRFADGTTLTSGNIASSSGSLGGYTFDHQFASTETILTRDFTATVTAAGTCISTVTLTTQGGNYLEFSLIGLYRNDTSAQTASGGFLLDAAYFDGQTPAIGLFTTRTGSLTQMSIKYRTRNRVSAASHNVCLYLFVSANNGEFFCTPGTYDAACRFEVKEVPW